MTIMLDSVSFLFNLYFWIIVKHILENFWLTALVKMTIMALDLEIRSDQISHWKLRVNLPLIDVRWVATAWTMRFQWTMYQWHQNATTCQIFIEPMCTSFEISRHFILTYWTWCTFWPYFRAASAVMILPWEHNKCCPFTCRICSPNPTDRNYYYKYWSLQPYLDRTVVEFEKYKSNYLAPIFYLFMRRNFDSVSYIMREYTHTPTSAPSYLKS